MDRNMKQLVFGVYVALLVLGAFVSAASAATGYVEEEGSIQAADELIVPFYGDAIVIYPHAGSFDHLIGDDDEYLAHKKRISLYRHALLKSVQNTKNIRETGITESDCAFSLYGDAELLWNYEDTKENSEIDLDWINDVDGDGVSDIVTSDNWNGSGKLLLLSSHTGTPIWSRDFGREIEIAGDIRDMNGDGMYDIIVYSDKYNIINNETTLSTYLISGSDGDTIWSKISAIGGDWNIWGTAHENDFNGDGVNDALFRGGGGGGYDLWHLDAISGTDGSIIWHVAMNESFGGGCTPGELPELNGDGIGDYVASSYSYNVNVGNVTALSGKDGYMIWSRSITGYDLWTLPYFDFNKDGVVDVVVEGDDRNNGTGSIFMIDGRDGSTIWNKFYNESVEVGCWLYDDVNDDGVYDLVVGSDTVQMLSGATGDAIWEGDYKVADAGTCKDIDGDGKNDVLAVNYTQIDSHNYRYNVIALSGINGNKIWGASFIHHVEVILPEGVWNNTYCWTFSHGWGDQNGDGVPDPYLKIVYHWSYWNESASEQDEYSALKFIMMDGANGGELWDAEITSACWDGIHWTCSGYDFDGDGVDDMFFSTRSGIYVVKTTGTGSVNRPPIASFTYIPLNPSTDDTITFNASHSYDPDGTIASYEWNFGDDNIIDRFDPVITYSYSSDGDYTVNLTVTDHEGAKHSVSKTIIITTLRGDINHDRVITSADAVIALNMAARGGWNTNADVNGDGQVSSLDTLMILQAAVGNIKL